MTEENTTSQKEEIPIADVKAAAEFIFETEKTVGALAENTGLLQQKAEKAAEAATDIAGELNTILGQGKTDSAEVDKLRTLVKTNADDVNAILAQTKANQTALLAMLEKAKTDSAATAEIARIADEKENRVKEYEQKLKTLEESYIEVKEKIESTLPGATSAGLAKAFNTRKKALEPTLKWSLKVFFFSTLGLIAVGIWALFSEIKSMENFLVFAFERSPLIAGLIFLEEFSRRLHQNTQRLEEDYAFKEAISMAFDGYKAAMSKIDDEKKDTLAKKFSENVLSVLNERPGRLYEVERNEKISPEALLAALKPEAGISKESLGLKIYEDFKKHFSWTPTKATLTIIMAVALGVWLGYNLSRL